MKIEELVEASVGTSVASIGRVAYGIYQDHIKLYRRGDDQLIHIANIRRRKRRGWRFEPTKGWTVLKLPHFGNAHTTRVRGIKTNTCSLNDTLKYWGIRCDSMEKIER